MTDQLIPISKASINGADVQTCDARKLHAFLKSKQQFGDWIKSRIEKYGFIEGTDFITLHNFMKQDSGSWGGHNRIDYALTLDMAKQ